MAKVKGGQKFEKYLTDIKDQISGNDVVRVGFLSGATYPNGTPVAMIAAIQEFGAPSVGIPPRPFIRNMIRSKKSEWGPAMARLMRTTGYNITKTLELTGQAIAGQMRQSIVDTNSPPNAPSTIARKGHAKPLVDSGHMLQSIDYEVGKRS